jgi:hypothetical protein
MARDAANEARLAAEAKAKAEALSPAAIAAITAQQVAAGLKSTDAANRLPGETASQANARITQGYKDQPKPDLTQEGKAAGATLEFVRTGAGGVGTYKEVFPIGTPIPTTRTTESGNVYDAKGNLISGTGLKTTKTTTTTTTAGTTNPITTVIRTTNTRLYLFWRNQNDQLDYLQHLYMTQYLRLIRCQPSQQRLVTGHGTIMLDGLTHLLTQVLLAWKQVLKELLL